MTEFERELSNLSYTNKDFSTIYPELLDLAKKLSYKWDPTTSNESDPGVVLLKLAALMADKTNYNIDKNILELFPLSVSQDTNARQIFEQCGYCMKYYQAATTNVTLQIRSEPELKDITYETDEDKAAATRRYEIPRFTMVTNSDSTNVYTITEPVFVDTRGYGETVSTEVMQGVSMHYAINGDTLITAENLDYNKRLYFTEQNVAENGIFICHKDTEDYEDWIKVDNLLIQPEKTLCYKFGLTDGGATCYIEFPADIVELIGEGVNITYIVTDGASGNIGKNRLTQFYGDLSINCWDIADDKQTKENVSVTNENINIKNDLPSTNGKDPETIDEAYSNYERVKTTFDTLVNTNDYSNALVTSRNASNGFVCDRNNDIQSAYIVTDTDLDMRRASYHVNETEKLIIAKSAERREPVEVYVTEPELSAFDLRIYAFEYSDNDASLISYVRSYTMTDDFGSASLKTGYFGAIHELKSLNHDFKDIIEDRIALLKNKFPLIARIIPSFKLSAAQQSDIVNKVYSALYKQLHSSNVSFAEAGAYDIIYDTILNADPRIKALALEDLTYETYAVFKHNGEFYELQIDDKSQGFYKLTGVTSDTFKSLTNVYKYVPSLDQYQRTYSFETNETYYTKDFFELWKKFRKEVYVRSILAGNTPLFEPDNPVSWSANMHVATDLVSNEAYYLKTEAKIPFTKIQEADNVYWVHADKQYSNGNWGVRPNENVIFVRPSLITKQSYAAYTKVFYNLHCFGNSTELSSYILPRNSDYILGTGEFIVFLWKDEDSDYSPYNYVRYDEGTIISPTYELLQQTIELKQEENGEKFTVPLSSIYDLNATFPKNSTSSSAVNIALLDTNSYIDAPVAIKEFHQPQFVLSGERQIDIKGINSVILPKNIYFMLNDDSYTLFDEEHRDIRIISEEAVPGKQDQHTITESYTLKTGEYLIYTNDSRTQLVMLEGGTKITREYVSRKDSFRSPWFIDTAHQVTNKEFLSNGVDAIEGHWFIINDSTATATETEYIQIGSGTRISIDITNGAIETTTDSEGRPQILLEGNSRINLAGCRIQYKTMTSSSWETTNLAYITHKDYAWEMYSILNVECSNNKWQKLEKHQTITVCDSYKEPYTSPELKYTDCYIKSNICINGTGPLINVQTWNTTTSMYTPCSILPFKLSESSEGADEGFYFVETSNEGSCSIAGPKLSGIEAFKTLNLNDGIYQDSNTSAQLKIGNNFLQIDFNGAENYTNYEFRRDSQTSVVEGYDDSTKTITISNTKVGSIQVILTSNNLIQVKADETTYTFDRYVFTSSTEHATTSFVLPAGDYIVPLTIANPFEILTVKLNNTDINVIQEVAIPDSYSEWYKNSGRFFLKMTLTDLTDDVSNFILTFDGVTTESNSVVIGSPYKYVYQKYLTSKEMNKYPYREDGIEITEEGITTDFSDILEYVVSLDKNRVFNYTYEIPAEYLIKQPTSASAFLDTQHVMNPYTICQWDVYSPDNSILVLNKLKQ